MSAEALAKFKTSFNALYNYRHFGLRVRTCLDKAQIAGSNGAVFRIYSIEEANLESKMIVHGLTVC